MPHSLAPEVAAQWQTTLDFHRHACPGLALGFRISVDALAFLQAPGPSVDEEVVCIAETDSCAVDAIQAIVGCSIGKGNLVLRLRGKHAFTFFLRGSNRAARFLWCADARHVPRAERIAYFLSAPAKELYRVTEPTLPLPEKAPLLASLVCAQCAETTAEPYIRVHNGQFYCLDCHPPRFTC